MRMLQEQSYKDGYVPMREYGWHKCMAGQTTLEEVISVTSAELC
jgi:type II secretory ATPase GspE/PulE/Tfp pilus assembly ATPase PilB-like protein